MLPMTMTTPLSLFAAPPLYDVGARSIPWNWQLAASQQHQHHHKQWRRLQVAMEKARQRLDDTWSLIDHDEAAIDLHVPNLEDGSLSARLSQDGRSLKLAGKRCTCQDDTFAEIALPFGAATAEDVEIVQGEAPGTLTVRAKKPAPEPIKIIKASPAPAHQADATEEPATPAPTRDVKKEEKELESKFKIAVDGIATQAAVVEKMKSAMGDAIREEDGEEDVENKRGKAQQDQEYPHEGVGNEKDAS